MLQEVFDWFLVLWDKHANRCVCVCEIYMKLQCFS